MFLFMKFHTAGESHGRGLIALIEGVPAGLRLSASEDIDPELKRRQGGYGRGDRMKIEQDRAEFLSGVRLGETLGSPLSMVIWNRDWENWRTAMSHEAQPDADDEALRRVHLPRPGHADLVGVLKYDRTDARDILERASARETTARVAAGAVAKTLLRVFGITIGSHIVSMGEVSASVPDDLPADLNAVADASPVRTIDKNAEARMIEQIDRAKLTGDTLGGCFEVVIRGVPAGLGSHISWDRRLDGRLAQAMMSIQAMKGVEIGLGFEAARRFGSQVHDVIESGYTRASNRAGGLEGGMTTGGPIVLRVAMKPLSTLMRPLATVDIKTGERGEAVTERSDVAALAAAGVVGEAMAALIVADAMVEKFAGDSIREMRRNYDGYVKYLEERGGTV
jgi:chorismate synthase